MKQQQDEKQDDKRPMVVFNLFSPYMFVDVNNFVDDEGNPLPTQPVMSLCRCGSSALKPYCDGTHSKIGFAGKKEEGRVEDRTKDYPGKHITIHDNRSVCAHVAHCIPEVFSRDNTPGLMPTAQLWKKLSPPSKNAPQEHSVIP